MTSDYTTSEEGIHASLRYTGTSDLSEEEVDESAIHHQRIQRARTSFEQLQEATLHYANDLASFSYTPARLEELRRFVVEEMDAGNERLACIHFCALIYMSPVSSSLPWEKSDPMTAYLTEQKALNEDFFHPGQYPIHMIRRRLEDHFDHCLYLNRLVCHEWTNQSVFVAPIHEHASATIELPNPAYHPVPSDVLALLHLPKKRKIEQPLMEQQVERSATNEDFRLVQLSFFYEFRQMIVFAEALEEAVIERVQCGGSEPVEALNNVGWMLGLFRNPNASRIIIPMQENIHQLFIYPGNIRHMQLSLNYDLSLVSASVVASTIQSDTFMVVAKQLNGNMPLLWSDMATVSQDKEELAWDVRAGVLLFHFYLLHIIYTEQKAEDKVIPLSIYTIRRRSLFPFRLIAHSRCLLLFRRRAYLCRSDGVVCYEGYHAVEQGLKAWVHLVHGPHSQLAHVMELLHVPTANALLPSPQLGLSVQTTQIPNSAYATTVPRGSIFSNNGT